MKLRRVAEGLIARHDASPPRLCWLGGDARLASAGERLEPGDVVSTGTMPGCCGLELDRWIQPGQAVELEIDRIGTLSNRIDRDAEPRNATVAGL